MFERGNTFKGLISPEKAEELLEKNTFEGQRSERREHIQRLTAAIADGSFRGADIALAKKSFNGGEVVLVNGQHQLNAIVASGKQVYGVIEQFTCHSPDDLWKLFGTFDVHRARTEAHIMKAAKGLFKSETLQSVPLRVMQLAGSALVYLGGGTHPNFSTRATDKTLKPSLVQKYESDVHRVANHFTGETHKIINAGVATAIIATYRAAGEDAADFWDRVLIGDGLSKSSPQFKLRTKLLQPTINWIRTGDSTYRIQGVYCTCIAWWNAHRTGTERKIVSIGQMTTVPEVEK